MKISKLILAAMASVSVVACGPASNAADDGGQSGSADASSGCDDTECAGECVDLTGDVDNCGACGASCDEAVNAFATCERSACAYTCEQGFGDCGGNSDCETDLANDASNCGTCGTVCPDALNGTGSCSETCGVTCDLGFADCSGDEGCEVETASDPDNCGGCGITCSDGDSCVDSDCVGSVLFNGDFKSGVLEPWVTENNSENGEDTEVLFAVGDGVLFSDSSGGPSARVVYQDFFVPDSVLDARLSFDFQQDNFEPLDPENVKAISKDPFDSDGDGFAQNAFRIDIVSATEQNPFDAPILFELFAPIEPVGDGDFLPVRISRPALGTFLRSHAGETLRLRIGQVESTFPWMIQIDDIDLSVTY